MTTVEAYVDRESKKIVSAIGGAESPAIVIVLGEWLALKLAWFKTGGVIEALTNGTPVTMVIKPALEHDAEALALDVSADETGSGASKRYTLKSLIDCVDLRTALNGKDSESFMLQVTWGTAGEESFGGTLPLAITVENNYSRDGDAVPDPLTNAGWEKIKAFIPASDSVAHNEEDKVIEITAAGGGGVSDHGELQGLEDDDHPQYLTEARADANYYRRGDVDAALALKAVVASPTFTGTPSAPTPASNTNTTQIATTAFVQAVVAALVNSSPLALDTLNELAAALGNDANFAATVNAALAARALATRTISAAGMATGGGDLSANRTITVPAASQAEAEEGTENSKGMTPARVHQAITSRAIRRGAGQISGHTDSGSAATPPPNISVGINSTGSNVITISDENVTLTFTFQNMDPANGTVWIDDSSFVSVEDYAAALEPAFDGVAPSNLSMTNEGSGILSVANSNTGMAAELGGSSGNGNASVTGGGIGQDESPPSGAVTETLLVNMISGKVTRAVRCGFVTGGAGISETVEIALKNGGSYTRLGAVGWMGNGQREECFITADTIDAWLMGITNAQIVLRFSGTVPLGGEITGWAMADHHQS